MQKSTNVDLSLSTNSSRERAGVPHSLFLDRLARRLLCNSLQALRFTAHRLDDGARILPGVVGVIGFLLRDRDRQDVGPCPSDQITRELNKRGMEICLERRCRRDRAQDYRSAPLGLLLQERRKIVA